MELKNYARTLGILAIASVAFAQSPGIVNTTVAFSSTPTFTATAGVMNFTITLTGNVTSITFASAAPGQDNFTFCQDNTGGRTVAWPGSFLGFGPIDPTPNKCSSFNAKYDGTNVRALSSCVTDGTSPGNVCGLGTAALQANPLTTPGDVLVGGTSGAFARLPNPGTGTFCFTWANGTSIPTLIACPGAGGGISSILWALPSWLTATPGTLTANGTQTFSATTGQTSHQVLGTCGSATTFGPCSLVIGDLPTIAFSNLSGAIAIGQTALTTRGDLMTVNSGGALTRLPIGTSSQVILGGTDPSYGQVPNAALVNPSTTVAGQTCTLGASCPIASTNLSDTAVIVRNNAANTYSGAGLQDMGAMKLKPPFTTVASLPSAAASTNLVFEVTDGLTATDCASGSGTKRLWCASNGTTWVAMALANAPYPQSFSSVTSVVLTHGFGTTNVSTTCFDNASPPNQVIPDKVTATDANDVTVTFTVAQSGKCVVTSGGGGGSIAVTNNSGGSVGAGGTFQFANGTGTTRTLSCGAGTCTVAPNIDTTSIATLATAQLLTNKGLDGVPAASAATMNIRSCEIIIQGISGGVLQNTDDRPASCMNVFGITETVTAVQCRANAGSPTVLPAVTGGSNVLSGNLTCGTGTFASGTLNGTPTVAANGSIDDNIVVAGGTATSLTIVITLSR